MIVVVGGGIAGVACARVLARGGADVRVLDRGRRLGGRLGERDYDLGGQQARPVDTGGSYFTVSDPDIEAVVEDWRQRGLARPWTDTFTVHSAEGERTSSGPTRWAAPTGLRSLVDDLAAGVEIHSGVSVDQIERDDHGLVVRSGRGVSGQGEQRADAVILAMPDPQARRLLGPGLGAETTCFDLEFEPVLALTTIWPDRAWPDRDGLFVNDDDVLSWVVDDGLRRGDRAPVLVAHSTPDFARPRLDEPSAAAAPMVDRLRAVVGIDSGLAPDVAAVHRWSFARPSQPRDQPFLLTASGLGACGDGWAAKPSVEAAFVSGTRLGRALLDREGDVKRWP